MAGEAPCFELAETGHKPEWRWAVPCSCRAGISLRGFVTEAVPDKLGYRAKAADKLWMAAFGKGGGYARKQLKSVAGSTRFRTG